MKIMYLAALAAAVGLAGCEKTEVNPPATVVTPAATTAPAPEVVPVPVPVQGPAGPAGEKGEKGDAGSTTVIVPEPAPPAQNTTPPAQ
ncbi:MAG TPA: hypothetical protein VFT37_11870 [Telluria sp.]|nr:hypothetical protein [Telluria sp.]